MILIVSSTNRPNSNARVISEIYAELLRQRGVAVQILDLTDLPQDFILSALYDNSGKHAGFNELNNLITAAEKFVFVVPEYNGSFPGVLKAFIDGLSYPSSFRHKKAALVGISTGTQGGALAVSHLTDIFNYMGMHVLAAKPRLMHIHKHLGSDNTLTNLLYLQLLQEQIDQFLSF
jgi:NAD(P)H-dependent FMN reductase